LFSLGFLKIFSMFFFSLLFSSNSQPHTDTYRKQFMKFLLCLCCDVAVAQINYPNLKHNTQDSIEQVRGRSHEKGLV
jgi:hypothetical protein